jgi:DNA-binding response OmpR family regulator
MRLLVVEDDDELWEHLKQPLYAAGFAVDRADNGVDGEHLGDSEPYDAIVLDLGLPQRPGLEVLGNWRSRGNATPVILLTARDAWHERVDGLKAGADDYLGKPFHMQELIARIEALIRRHHGAASAELRSGELLLDQESQTLHIGEQPPRQLTATEFRLLRYFMLNPGKPLSKSRLTEHVYEYDADRDSNVIEVYVNRLRKYLGKGRIQTLRGQGYRFEADPE